MMIDTSALIAILRSSAEVSSNLGRHLPSALGIL